MSKRTFGIVLTLVASLLDPKLVLAQPANSDPPPPCVEDGPYYGDWYLGSCPALNNSPSVSPTSFCGEVGQGPCGPTVIAPTFDTGIKYRDVTYDCADPATEDADISFDVGGVKWDPPLPGTWAEQHKPTFSSTAYVIVSGGDDLCPPPGRYDIGTVTWNIVGGTPITTSKQVDMSALKGVLDVLASNFLKQGQVCRGTPPGNLITTFTTATSTACCNGCADTTSGKKEKISGGGTLGLGSYACDFPFAGIPYVATVNVAINFTASITVTVSGTFVCNNLSQVCGNVSATGQVGGGVSVTVGHPKLLYASLTLQAAALSGSGTFCLNVDGSHTGTAQVCVGKVSVVGTVRLLGGAKFAVNVPLSSGTYCTPAVAF